MRVGRAIKCAEGPLKVRVSVHLLRGLEFGSSVLHIVYLGVPVALLKSILCCLALFVFVGFSVCLIKLGLILSKNSDIFW